MRDRCTILIVEDDDGVAELLCEHLGETVDAELVRARGAAEALSLDVEVRPQLGLFDLLLPDGNGLDLIRVLEPSYPILLMTAEPTTGRAIEALRLGVRDLLTKPFDLQRLGGVVREQLSLQRRAERGIRRIERQQQLIRKVLDERKALQERIDLLCKDLVGAYRDLAAKVAGREELPR